MMMALFPTLKGAARPITTPITTYHHIKHAPATSHKNQVNSLLYVRMFLRATSAMMDVPTDEQELPEPVKLRALCEVSDEWEKLGRIRHQRTT